MTRRVSSKQLINEFVDKIKIAQEIYKNSIENFIQEWKNNISMCSKMDEEFGEDYEGCVEDDAKVIKAKDGSHLTKCPISNCATKTFKLRRHLRDIHPSLSENVQEFAIDISKKIERNKGEY